MKKTPLFLLLRERVRLHMAGLQLCGPQYHKEYAAQEYVVRAFCKWLEDSGRSQLLLTHNVFCIEDDTALAFMRYLIAEKSFARDGEILTRDSVSIAKHGNRLNALLCKKIDFVQEGLWCPQRVMCDCGTATVLYTGFQLFGDKDRANEHFYVCPVCGKHVGCHSGTNISFGTPADSKTRKLRKEVHNAFDQKWRKCNIPRSDAYRWLSDKMGNNLSEIHIGMMDEEKCLTALGFIKEGDLCSQE